MYSKTLVQFENKIKEEFFSEKPEGITRKEWDEIYPRESRLGEWIEEIQKAALSQTQISQVTLDDLCKRGQERFVLHLMHDWLKLLPEGYLTVQARQRQKEKAFKYPKAIRR